MLLISSFLLVHHYLGQVGIHSSQGSIQWTLEMQARSSLGALQHLDVGTSFIRCTIDPDQPKHIYDLSAHSKLIVLYQASLSSQLQHQKMNSLRFTTGTHLHDFPELTTISPQPPSLTQVVLLLHSSCRYWLVHFGRKNIIELLAQVYLT